MYLDFYGLKRRPFDMTPDPMFFFPSQKHKEALASLTYAVMEKRGFVVITGEIGSGKTTVCRTLLQKLDPAARVAVLTNTTLTPKQLLEAICEEFGLPPERHNKVALLFRLKRFLLEQNDAGSTVVLILDEAQNLTVKALEEVRLLSNMETDTQKLIQVMLLGQPELRDKLNRPELEQLRQRINLRYHLRSLDRDEILPYIEHRLRIAGDEGRVTFTKGAVHSVYEFSRGVPRLINVVCDQALLTGYLRETRKIDPAIVSEIIAEFKCPAADEESGREAAHTQRKAFSFWRLFRRKRDRSAAEPDVASFAASSGAPRRANREDEAEGPCEEAEIISRLSEARLAGISSENGSFVATVDGLRLRAGDNFLGMSVAGVDQHRIVFNSGGRSYELSIESHGDVENENWASPQTGAESHRDTGAALV